MHPARPQVPSRPCPACAKPVDPLRAPEVVIVPTGPRYLCSEGCRQRFLDSVRTQDLRQKVQPAPVTVPQRVREATRPSIILPAADASTSTMRRPALLDIGDAPIPWPSLLAAVGAFVVAMVARTPLPGALSALLVVASAALTLKHHAGARADIGWLAWAAGPLGASLAAVGGWLALTDDPSQWWGLAAAAIAAAAMSLRALLDARGREPVAEAVRGLLAGLPTRARIPARDEGEGARYEEVHISEVRAGEVVLVVEGETLGVDGIVQAGEAEALLHPGAQSPEPRRPGDALIAGARITRGALRVRASRVGAERAIVRIPRFGLVTGRRAARTARLADRIRTIGGLVAMAAAGAGLLLTGEPGLAGAITAAGAVLLAAPLLAARRAAEAPFVAAAAAAASRGILFSDARTLDTAGRVSTAALCTTGTVTMGHPEVVEVTTIGDADVASVLGVVAGACVRLDGPLAKGIRRYTRAHAIEPRLVRRVVRHPGRGVSAFVPGGEALVVGNRQLLLDEGISVAVADAAASRAEERGETAVFVGVGGRVRAVLALRDEVRPGARAAVQRMFDQQIEVVLVSGDHRATVEALASTLDVQNVKAELVPDEQREAVRSLAGSGDAVAAVGFAPANADVLAAAAVPIVLDAAGAQGERGIALATDDVRDAAAALWIARAARSEAWRGVLLATGAGSLLMAAAVLGWAGPAVAALGALAIDARALLGGARLLHRVALRIPLR